MKHKQSAKPSFAKKSNQKVDQEKVDALVTRLRRTWNMIAMDYASAAAETGINYIDKEDAQDAAFTSLTPYEPLDAVMEAALAKAFPNNIYF